MHLPNQSDQIIPLFSAGYPLAVATQPRNYKLRCNRF
jgi:hypothetical protein